MSIIDTLITDRSQADVAALRALAALGWDNMTPAQKAAWSASKGAYNATDLNRVGEAMDYLAALMDAAGVNPDYTPMQILGPEDIPGDGDSELLFANLLAFWAAAETVTASVAQTWDPYNRGDIPLTDRVRVGDVVRITDIYGLLRLEVTLFCAPGAFAASGNGWEISQTATGLLAVYRYPQSGEGDLDAILDALEFCCVAESGDWFFTEISASAVMRSGAADNLGTCEIVWTSLLQWRDLEAYGFTWGDIEAQAYTWEELTHLPIPEVEQT